MYEEDACEQEGVISTEILSDKRTTPLEAGEDREDIDK